MTPRRFFLLLALTSLAMAVCLLLLEWVPQIARHRALSWSSWAGLLIFCVLMFWGGQITLKSPSLNTFSQFFIVSIASKMMLCLAIFLLYRKQCPDTDTWAVIPFFGVYLGFTAFEVYFLGKMSKT